MPEYWVVDPGNESIIIYSLNDKNKYTGSRPYLSGDTIYSEVLKGLALDVEGVFSK